MKWAKPRAATGLDVAFGPSRMSEWLPAWEEIPVSFRRDRGPWCVLASRWFLMGLTTAPVAKAGVNQTHAIGHCKTILMSFEPKHEHKIAGVAYLMSLWFELPEAAQ